MSNNEELLYREALFGSIESEWKVPESLISLMNVLNDFNSLRTHRVGLFVVTESNSDIY